MRLLVCGSRTWANRDYLCGVLDGIHASQEVSTLIEGEAHGADVMAAAWARSHRIAVVPFTADWSQHGRAAGIIRNNAMLKLGRPELVVAFHPDIQHSKGTGDMVTRARAAGVECWIFTGPKAHSAAMPQETEAAS